MTIASNYQQAIAIIGMAGYFPDAQDIHQFWQNLLAEKESVTFFSEEQLLKKNVPMASLADPNYIRAGITLENKEKFAAEFFAFSPSEAELMDPQQRLLLENAYTALENAGYASDKCSWPVGVFMGCDLSSYLIHNLLPQLNNLPSQSQLQLTYTNGAAATQISYKLNLHGPSLDINTACSSSLVAIHLACRSLLCYECDMALAGGSSVSGLSTQGYFYQQDGILSRDGHCRAFDVDASGTIAGQGSGVVVLKRYEDALADEDIIYAIIRGSAINNDGSQKVGYTAPSVKGQLEVIQQALTMAEVEAETIDYIECHGTATIIGDPIEAAALREVYGNSSELLPCYLGSVKSNIGHLNSAAGVAGLIKTVSALQHKQLPSSLHFKQLNPLINYTNTRLQVNNQLRTWPRHVHPRRAAVSSFGIGGTNAHIILEEAPNREIVKESNETAAFILSAKTMTALIIKAQQLADYIKANPATSLHNIGSTLQHGRNQFTYRYGFACNSALQAIDKLNHLPTVSASNIAPTIAILFSGQGEQIINFAKYLYQTAPYFHDTLIQCCNIYQKISGKNVLEILYPNEPPEKMLMDTRYVQPILFICEYSLALFLIELGIKPSILIGHSLGEYVAACVAQVWSLQEVLELIFLRSQLIHSLPAGKMLAVSASFDKIHNFLNETCSLAAVNSPNLSVISGSEAAIAELEIQLLKNNYICKQLEVERAFHSAMIEPILPHLSDKLYSMKLSAPKIPIISTVSGKILSDVQAQDPQYWLQQLRQPVQFSAAICHALSISNYLFLEVGPSQTLTFLVKQHKSAEKCKLLTTAKAQNTIEQAYQHLMGCATEIWMSGVNINWDLFSSSQRWIRIALPTYPFERQRYWIDSLSVLPDSDSTNTVSVDLSINKTQHLRPELESTYQAPRNALEEDIANLWSKHLGIASIGVLDNFFALGGNSLLALQINKDIQQQYDVKISMKILFDAPTVAGVADAILATLLQQRNESEKEHLLTNLDANEE